MTSVIDDVPGLAPNLPVIHKSYFACYRVSPSEFEAIERAFASPGLAAIPLVASVLAKQVGVFAGGGQQRIGAQLFMVVEVFITAREWCASSNLSARWISPPVESGSTRMSRTKLWRDGHSDGWFGAECFTRLPEKTRRMFYSVLIQNVHHEWFGNFRASALRHTHL